jgi:hypothetical protein
MYSGLVCTFVYVRTLIIEKVYVVEISADFKNLFDRQSENMLLNS